MQEANATHTSAELAGGEAPLVRTSVGHVPRGQVAAWQAREARAGAPPSPRSANNPKLEVLAGAGDGVRAARAAISQLEAASAASKAAERSHVQSAMRDLHRRGADIPASAVYGIRSGAGTQHAAAMKAIEQSHDVAVGGVKRADVRRMSGDGASGSGGGKPRVKRASMGEAAAGGGPTARELAMRRLFGGGA